MKFSESLKEARMEAKITQAALAKKTGISQQLVSKIEAGLVESISIDMVKKLADALNVQPGDIYPSYSDLNSKKSHFFDYNTFTKENVPQSTVSFYEWDLTPGLNLLYEIENTDRLLEDVVLPEILNHEPLLLFTPQVPQSVFEKYLFADPLTVQKDGWQIEREENAKNLYVFNPLLTPLKEPSEGDYLAHQSTYLERLLDFFHKDYMLKPSIIVFDNILPLLDMSQQSLNSILFQENIAFALRQLHEKALEEEIVLLWKFVGPEIFIIETASKTKSNFQIYKDLSSLVLSANNTYSKKDAQKQQIVVKTLKSRFAPFKDKSFPIS